MKVDIVLLVICFNLISCTKDVFESPYSFFVAGHSYGNPALENNASINTLGLHSPFQNKLQSIKTNDQIEFGVLTGDIVWLSTEKEWDAVDEDIAKTSKRVYFAPGNHDIADRALYESRYGPTYFNFIHKDDLYIVLDPNLAGWSIEGEQLEFLEKTLKENASKVDNIFVFFHQLLWWSPNNFYNKVIPNSTQGRREDMNFWDRIEPLFHSIPNMVYMFSGDVGAFSSIKSVAYHHYDNITLIASGMGGGTNDNYVLVQVDKDKTVHFKLIALNYESEDALGALEEHNY